jgi:hypothetical protein
MTELTTGLGRKLAPHREMLLHLAFLGSLGCLAAGWLLLDLLGPMSIILPLTFTIGVALSEAERLFHPVLRKRHRSGVWIRQPEEKRSPWTTKGTPLVTPRRPADFEELHP